MVYAIQLINFDGERRWFAPSGAREEFFSQIRAERVAARLNRRVGGNVYDAVKLDGDKVVEIASRPKLPSVNESIKALETMNLSPETRMLTLKVLRKLKSK